MGTVEIHYPHETEIATVYTACMISMLRLAGDLRMTPTESIAFAFAHDVLADFMGRLTEPAIDAWRKGILVALEEIRQEDQKDGRDHQSNSTDTGGDGTHHA